MHESGKFARLHRLWQQLTHRESANTNHGRRYLAWRDRFVRGRLKLGLGIVGLAYLSFFLLELFNLAFQPDNFLRDWFISQIATLIFLGLYGVFLQLPWGRRHPGLTFVLFSITITLIPLIQRTLRGLLIPSLLLWPALFLGQATLIPVRWPLHLISQLIPLGTYFGLQLLGVPNVMPIPDLPPTTLLLYLAWTCGICNLSVYLYERLRRSEFAARQQLEEAYDRISEEQARSERLLLNILPRAIAHRLKQQTQHSAIADSFANAGVLFADIVGFTALSGRISPPELVALLNEIFSEFDRLVEIHDLEKIKTIGDAYMVVSGLPEPREDFADAIADMALDMKQALNEFNERHQHQHQHQFHMRVGIAVGPVVAGVIGLKKFIYDLWGDTVNLASRMESHGLPDAIQVTETTYEQLKDRYLFESRGEIEVKGKGTMRTYLLLGKRPQSSSLVISDKKNAQD